jgi:hypothetical protein
VRDHIGGKVTTQGCANRRKLILGFEVEARVPDRLPAGVGTGGGGWRPAYGLKTESDLGSVFKAWSAISARFGVRQRFDCAPNIW